MGSDAIAKEGNASYRGVAVGQKNVRVLLAGLIGENLTVMAQEPPGARIVSEQFSRVTRKPPLGSSLNIRTSDCV